jgi:hypothetical protein
MPRFYLNINNSNGVTPDEEGQEFPGIQDARQAALAGIRSILAAEVASGRIDLGGRIDIMDSNANLLLSIAFEEAVDVRFRDP